MKIDNANEQIADNSAAVAAEGAQVAPKEVAKEKGAGHKKGAPKAKQGAKGGQTKAAAKKQGQAGVAKKAAKPATKPATKPASKSASKSAAKEATSPRPESKGAKILGLIGRAKGATLAEIMKATDWQAHSVRGWISTAGKKHGVEIESSKNEAGERVYRIAK